MKLNKQKDIKNKISFNKSVPINIVEEGRMTGDNYKWVRALKKL